MKKLGMRKNRFYPLGITGYIAWLNNRVILGDKALGGWAKVIVTSRTNTKANDPKGFIVRGMRFKINVLILNRTLIGGSFTTPLRNSGD